jgi:transposase
MLVGERTPLRPTCKRDYAVVSAGVFHLVGLDLHGGAVVRKKFSRKQLLHFTANLKVELIGMEACGGSHFLGRALREQGHEVRLIPAQYVKPYVKTNKSDFIDAEAIAEAVARPTKDCFSRNCRTARAPCTNSLRR